jgi:hypothetical protein
LRPGHVATLVIGGTIFETLGRCEETIADLRQALSLYSEGRRAKETLKRLGALPSSNGLDLLLSGQIQKRQDGSTNVEGHRVPGVNPGNSPTSMIRKRAYQVLRRPRRLFRVNGR